MSKLRVLVFLVVVLPLLLLPAMVSAQAAELPHMFFGSATIDGVNAAAGTKVSAEVDGKEVATANYNGTLYSITVAAPIGTSFKDKDITFKVGAGKVATTAKHTPGDVTNQAMAATTAPAGPPAITVSAASGVIAQVSGTNFPANAAVSITGGASPVSATADAGGKISAMVLTDVSKPGKVTLTAGTATADFNVLDLKGAVGPAGAAGAAGKAGAAGAAGKAGADGKAGAAGPAGKDGAPGKAGATGATGPAGAAGAKGADGAAAPVAILWIALVIAVVGIVLSVLSLARKPAKAAA